MVARATDFHHSSSLGLQYISLSLFFCLLNHDDQSKERLFLPSLVVAFLHDVSLKFLLVDLAIFVKKIVLSQRNIHTTTSQTLQHVNYNKSRSSHPCLHQKWLEMERKRT
jgi:hypothetical protein